MQKVTTFLMFNNQAEQALAFYTSVFKGARKVGSAAFEIEGQQFMVANGGPDFQFAPGISLMINCETQAEIDHYWERLSEGGEKQPCGWVKDQFGVSWQVVPAILLQLLSDPDRNKANRALKAMLSMTKLDIAALKRAHEG
jgi:predicted 3-demethylubiquinone-9 3-methyltransferase (glyoxalase superfamily)